MPMPSHYVASIICELVSPINRMQACTRAPECYDALAGLGLSGDMPIEQTASVQQLQMIVMAYSNDTAYHDDIATFTLSKQGKDFIKHQIDVKLDKVLRDKKLKGV